MLLSKIDDVNHYVTTRNRLAEAIAIVDGSRSVPVAVGHIDTIVLRNMAVVGVVLRELADQLEWVESVLAAHGVAVDADPVLTNIADALPALHSGGE